MQKNILHTAELTPELCHAESVAFLMLSEIMRARCQDILDHLKQDQIDIQRLRRVALHMQLSADDLIRDPGLLKEPLATDQANASHSTGEPASLLSIVEMAMIAARHRTAQLGIQLSNQSLSKDIFIRGNPWEVAYAIFTILRHSANAKSRHPLRGSQHTTGKRDIAILSDLAEGFVEISITSDEPLDPNHPESKSTFGENPLVSKQEWFCLHRLLEKNSVQLRTRLCEKKSGSTYCVVLKIPTHQPGFEDSEEHFTA
jgi:hypothetical protein